ncbi:MAG: DEAD/DEAH box helicase family protein [Coriobacteriaceae bacterium]|nr:DEAD/DEAH box helicase family protein [Coriobacteriaceae bacterium]
MAKRLSIAYDSGLIDSISTDFDLRAPNKEALRKLVFALDGDYDPAVMQVMGLATGVGKTYLMAAFIEYLRRQGVGNVVIVTPGKVVQAKTVQNFTQGSPRYIKGSPVPPEVVTPQDYSAWVARQNGAGALSYGREVPTLAFVFNIQQLIAPTSAEGATHGDGQQAQRRKPRRFDENAGVLFDYLRGLDELVVIADESHLYSTSAEKFHSALEELDPAACVGLTASPSSDDHVVWRYPLWRAIQDEYVKQPVLAFRKSGYGTDEASEEQQLADACQLRQIKQRFYDSWCERQGLARLNAVLFVVCADTDHATQVASLLRTPRYFGDDMAVLQVDSNHDDDTTARLLEHLDDPGSPVLAVVSVNKLKEGWDVKNIAVVVTLRAMASDVLTQQTMGRGLRLPFGSYTHVRQIDQLDIIAHQSFKELLETENVLVQFGLDDAAADAAKADEQIKAAAKGGRAGSVHAGAAGSPGAGYGTRSDGRGGAPSDAASGMEAADGTDAPQQGTAPEQPTLFGGVGFSSIGQRGIVDDGTQGRLSVETVPRNPAFADVSYLFPRTAVRLSEPDIDLSKIDPKDIRAAAERVTSAGDVLLRKEIVAALGVRLHAVDTESAEVDSLPVSENDAQTTLLRLVMNGGLIPATEGNKSIAKAFLIKRFMQEAPLDHWTVKSLESATAELRSLLRTFVDEALRNRVEETEINPLAMPSKDELTLPIGDVVHEQVETQAEFVRGRFYGGWFKSLFEAESFDSYTGEYLLAKLLNTSPHIVWWQRLHPQEGAYVYYNAKDRYFPDFVARDDGGVHWIIEGKDARGRDDATVQAKRRAAESVVVRLLGDDRFTDQSWGYLIAYEDDIKASDSWGDLLAKSSPVSNGQ